MLYSILQIIAFQVLFLLVYDLFLRKETFFNYNRAYLLLTSFLALFLPFIKLPKLKAMTTKDLVIQLPEVFIGPTPPTEFDIEIAESAGIALSTVETPVWQVFALVGMAVACLIMVLKFIKLYWLRHYNPKRWKGNILIVEVLKSSAAFSFFNTIFLGERISKQERPAIYKHELVHIKEWHSLDLLYFEILGIILWFNPLVYMYHNRIKELHEYIADAKAVKQNGKAVYYQSLLNQVFDTNHLSFTNTFYNKSLIKKRIAMLQKSKSKHRHLAKYTLLVPLILTMLIYTSTEVRAQQESDETERTAQELTEAQWIQKYYDEIMAMEKNGASFMEVSSYASFGKYKPEKYILSKEEFLKFKAYMRYVADGMIKRKSEKGTLENQDFDTAELMKKKEKSYVEYRSWKKTKEAKDLWEASIRDGERKLFIEDMLNKTEEEQQRYDTLLNQLETDESVEKVIITDGKSLLILYPANKDEVHEINIPADSSVEVPFAVIDEVPTTEDCKNLPTNIERKKCMSQFVAMHVNRNFNIGLADSLGIKGRQRIFVAFKIDKQGLIKDAKARAVHPDLENEAIRVIKTLPQFVPGKHKGETVVVPYSLPIVFQIKGTEDNANHQKLIELEKQRDRILENSSENNPVVIQLNKQIDSLQKERSKLLELFLNERSKNTKATTTVLINRNDQFLINDKRSDLSVLDELLRTKASDKTHLVRIIYDKSASKSTINQVVTVVKKYPFASIKQEIGGPLPVDKNIKSHATAVPYSTAEVGPAHPDCKDVVGVDEQKKCTSNAVASFVNRNFDMNLASSLDLPDGKQRIFARFVIDAQGSVSDIDVRASHPKLEEEVKRVLQMLPQFVPGQDEGQNVKVAFSLPIVFQFSDSKKKND